MGRQENVQYRQRLKGGGQQGGFDSKRYDTTLLGGSSMVARAVEQPAE